MNPRSSRPPGALRSLWPLLLPLLAAVAVYHAVGTFGFVNFDDDNYVYGNPRVTDGLSAAGARWAFTTGHEQVWIPATWLSLQLDATLAGPGPAGFHRTNLALHLAAVALTWLLARRLSGSTAAATLVALLLAVHPVNVEAVCWVTARKDVLMTPLLLGAALAWVTAAGPRGLLPAGALAAWAMLAKPAAVVAPLLLLLLALLPGWRGEGPGRPRRAQWVVLGVLALAAVVVALVTTRLAQHGAMGAVEAAPPAQRVLDAAGGVVRYLARLAWPAGLAVRYPEADLRLALPAAVASALGVVAVTALLLRQRRRLPLAAFGWLWFLVCLLPSLGLVQGGQLPLGDRYVYLAALGLWLPLAAAAVRLGTTRPRLRVPLACMAVAVVVALGVAASRQAGTWRDAESLWRHALATTRDNDIAHQNLAVVLDDAGRPEEALTHLQAAIRIRPRSETHFNAGNVCAALGRDDQAEAHYRAALRLNASLHEAAQNLGSLLGRRGRLDEARAVLLTAAQAAPGLASLQYNLAVVAVAQGDAAEAVARCRRALELDPSHAGAAELLGKIGGGAAAR